MPKGIGYGKKMKKGSSKSRKPAKKLPLHKKIATGKKKK